MAKLGLIIMTFMLTLANASPNERIVGGYYAVEGQYAHQVSLRKNGAHTCGGSILTRNFVLTAAHCVTYVDKDGSLAIYNPSFYAIRAGSTNRLMGGVLIRVSQITVHEDYEIFENDVALLRLESPLIFSKNIQPIAIATTEVPANEPVVISGWGMLTTFGEVPINLKWNTLKALMKDKCNELMEFSTDTLICLAHEPNNGACSGDSGGPAVYKGQLVGVAGFVVSGCGSQFPDGYAKVYYHREWIKQNSDL